ncbi:MAG: hypothetical protein K9J25_13635 [Bacteroidales bacterium]|nr:hypothetical protein [Bacteroidales bacterium]
MYHLVVENLGVKRCIAISEKDDFHDGMYADCRVDNGCIPQNHVRTINVICTGKKAGKLKAAIFKD